VVKSKNEFLLTYSDENDAGASMKYKVIDDMIKNLTASYENLKREVDNKAETIEMLKIENTKVSKEELLALLPSNDSKDNMKEEFRSEVAYFHKSLDELARAWDLKIVKLRKELDPFTIKKEISKRALNEEFKYEINKVETK
jgi:hypothetical protein